MNGFRTGQHVEGEVGPQKPVSQPRYMVCHRSRRQSGSADHKKERPMNTTTAESTKRRRTDAERRNPEDQAAIATIPLEEVAHRAYARFIARGMTHGGDLDDWLEAERELGA